MNTVLNHTPQRLSNAQAMLLQLFERDLPEEDLFEIKNLLTKYLFKKAEKAADNFMKENGITMKQLNENIKDLNNGSRTEYLAQIKKQRNESSN